MSRLQHEISFLPIPNSKHANKYKKKPDIIGIRHPFLSLFPPFHISSCAPDQSHNQVPAGLYMLYFISRQKLLLPITKQNVHHQCGDRFLS